MLRVPAFASVTLMLVAAACAGRVAPEAATLAPRPSLLTGDTLVVAFIDQRADQTAAEDARAALFTTLQRAYPGATVRPAAGEPGGAGTVEIRAFLKAYEVSFRPALRNQWTGVTMLGATLADRRRADSLKASTLINRTAVRSNMYGNRSGAEALRASFGEAASALVAFVDSAGDPAMATALAGKWDSARREYGPYLAAGGTATIAGQAFLTTRGGDVKTAAGRTVTLDPVTTVARDWYAAYGFTAAQFGLFPPDEVMEKARRITVADAEGRFRFSDLAPGRYIVRTIVTWEAPEGGTLTPQGGVVSAVVAVREGERKEIILNQTGNAFLR